MSEKKYEARQSKRMIIIACCSAGFFIMFFLGLLILFTFSLIGASTHDEYIVFLISLIWSGTMIGIILIILIYLIYKYNKQVYIYNTDSFICQINGKNIFEVPYKNIISIREGYDSLFMTLKTPIVKSNGKKGPRNFYEHYSRADIYQIKRIITDKFYNIPIQ